MMGGHRVMAAESAQRSSILSPSPAPPTPQSKKRKNSSGNAESGVQEDGLPTPPATQGEAPARVGGYGLRKKAKLVKTTENAMTTPPLTQESTTTGAELETPSSSQQHTTRSSRSQHEPPIDDSHLGSLADLALQSIKPSSYLHRQDGAETEEDYINSFQGVEFGVDDTIAAEALQVAAEALQAAQTSGADTAAPDDDDDAAVEGVIDYEEEEEDDDDDDEDDDDEEERYGEGEDELEQSAVDANGVPLPAAKLPPKTKGKAADGTKKKRTPREKKEPRVKRAKPLAAPRNRWGRSQTDVDADLKTLLDSEEKAQAYLASKWIDAKELHRLEELKLITYKRGKWSESERHSLREHITLFKTTNELDDKQLLDIILSKGRFDKRSAYPHFWAELAEKVPGRPVKYVVTAVQRMYDPRARKGAWTAAEDELLLKAYEKNPNKWTMIADVVERTVHDCRDRWKCELRNKDKRNKGAWTEEETNRLRDAVKEANTKAGLEPLSSDTPWDDVVKIMGDTRSRTQCRKKWQDTMGYGQRTKPTRTKLDSRVLLNRLRSLNIQHESDVEYALVTLPEWGLTPAQVRRKWNHLKGLVAERDLPFGELLMQIEANLRPEDWRKRKRAHSRSNADEAAAAIQAVANYAAAAPAPATLPSAAALSAAYPAPSVVDAGAVNPAAVAPPLAPEQLVSPAQAAEVPQAAEAAIPTEAAHPVDTLHIDPVLEAMAQQAAAASAQVQ